MLWWCNFQPMVQHIQAQLSDSHLPFCNTSDVRMCTECTVVPCEYYTVASYIVKACLFNYWLKSIHRDICVVWLRHMVVCCVTQCVTPVCYWLACFVLLAWTKNCYTSPAPFSGPYTIYQNYLREYLSRATKLATFYIFLLLIFFLHIW